VCSSDLLGGILVGFLTSQVVELQVSGLQVSQASLAILLTS